MPKAETIQFYEGHEGAVPPQLQNLTAADKLTVAVERHSQGSAPARNRVTLRVQRGAAGDAPRPQA